MTEEEMDQIVADNRKIGQMQFENWLTIHDLSKYCLLLDRITNLYQSTNLGPTNESWSGILDAVLYSIVMTTSKLFDDRSRDAFSLRKWINTAEYAKRHKNYKQIRKDLNFIQNSPAIAMMLKARNHFYAHNVDKKTKDEFLAAACIEELKNLPKKLIDIYNLIEEAGGCRVQIISQEKEDFEASVDALMKISARGDLPLLTHLPEQPWLNLD